MKNACRLAALVLTAFAAANAQGTKPVAKGGKMEAKPDEKVETKETAKGNKAAHYGSKMHVGNTVSKSKM
jgi:hypothetical protein